MKFLRVVLLFLLAFYCLRPVVADAGSVAADTVPVVKATRPVVAIARLGGFDSELAATIGGAVQRMYNVDIVVLSNRDLPLSCYYKPNHRYRAEKLLNFLDEDTEAKYTKIIGLTTWDISVTKGKLKDGPVSGFGFIGKRPCIASTYRLGGDKVSTALMVSRLVKIVNHELGHTFGLGHCGEQGCLMEDKGGTIRTVDSETGILCAECEEALGNVLVKDYDAKLPRLRAVSQQKR